MFFVYFSYASKELSPDKKYFLSVSHDSSIVCRRLYTCLVCVSYSEFLRIGNHFMYSKATDFFRWKISIFHLCVGLEARTFQVSTFLRSSAFRRCSSPSFFYYSRLMEDGSSLESPNVSRLVVLSLFLLGSLWGGGEFLANKTNIAIRCIFRRSLDSRNCFVFWKYFLYKTQRSCLSIDIIQMYDISFRDVRWSHRRHNEVFWKFHF